MRRADRLFQIIQLLLRRRTATTATHIAEKLGVSDRTVYRDIRDLVLAGTPIDGEAGVGYRIKPGYDLPPLMFDKDEIQALVLGARIVRQFGDPALARASESILNKVAAVIPKNLAPLLSETRLYVPSMLHGGKSADALSLAREALVGASCGSSTRTRRGTVPSEPCVRLAFSSGAGRGRWRRGVSCATTSATSVSTA
jgi:predicted DNA-binding transcriptional regulator YafY